MARILRFDPFRELHNLQAHMNRLFDEVFGSPGREALPSGRERPMEAFTPAVDVWEAPDAYFLRAELPGVTADDVNVEVTDNTLVMRGERKMTGDPAKAEWLRQEGAYGPFYRAIALPATVEADQVKARVQNGVLEVIIPKAESARTRRIPIAA